MKRGPRILAVLLCAWAPSLAAQEPPDSAAAGRRARAGAERPDSLLADSLRADSLRAAAADTARIIPTLVCPTFRAPREPTGADTLAARTDSLTVHRDSLAALPDTTRQKIRERTPLFPEDVDPYTPPGQGCPDLVITRDDLAGWPVTTLAEVLPRLYPLALDEQGGPGFFGDVRFPSGLPSQTRLLIDGRPAESPLGPAADLRTIPLAAIERIEIHRGAAPVTGGAEAGWIDVLTRTHLTPQANSALGFDLGTFGREAFTGGLGRWLGSRFSAVLTLRFDDGNTLTQVASAKNSQFFGKARLYLSRRHFIEASYGTSGTTNESRRTSPTALSPFTDTEDQRERRFQALYRGSVGLLRPQARYYTDRFEERDSFTLDAVPLVGGRADRRGAEAGVDLPVGRGRIRVGVEWVREELDSDSPLFLGADENVLADSTGFDDSRTRIAAFAGAEQTLDSLTVAAHVRGERFEAGRGTTVEPQLGLEARYGAGGGFTPFARVGRSARFPSFVETAALARAGGAPVVAPETLVEARGGSSWQRGEAAGELAAFVRRGSDLVLWLPPTGWRAATGDESARLGQVLPGDQEPGTEEPQPAFAELNRIDQRAIGADARLALRLPFNLSGEGFALVQSVEDEDGERLPYVPRAQALGRISYEKAFFPSRNLTLRGSIDSRVVGPRTTLSGGDLPAFAQMDAFLRARLIGFTAGLSVLNVFGQRVRTEESFPLPGRVVGFQIVWEFWD